MDLNIRDWMIIIGVLLIAAVLVDGYRRVRADRRQQIRMSLTRQALGNEDPNNPELLGGVRVRDRSRDPIDEAVDNDLELHQSVPVLMEIEGSGDDAREPPRPAVMHESPRPLVMHESPKVESLREPVTAPPATEAARPPKQLDVWDDAEAIPSEPARETLQEVMVIHVISTADGGFKGPDLLHILLACDLRFGKMNIFHRYERANGQGPMQFSVANMVEPGVFDLHAINDFSTPGVSFFLTLPGPENPAQAFEFMVETAQCLVKNLGAALQDETRSDITPQTLEHCRQRIRDFERRRLARQA